jgi:hypothetical protein
MACPGVPPEALLQFGQPSGGGIFVPEDRPVNLDGTVPPGPPDHDLIPLLVPFQQGTRPDTELPANLGGYRHLTLSRDP